MEALTVTVKLYIHYATRSYFDDKFVITTCDMSRNNPDIYILLETRDIEVPVNNPDAFDLIALQVDQLRSQKQTIAETAQRQIAAVDDKIQQLLCIDYSPVEENDVPF